MSLILATPSTASDRAKIRAERPGTFAFQRLDGPNPYLVACRQMPSLRTLLILGRTSNLPTVWSNCLAGWWLGGGKNVRNLFPLLLGSTLIYMGGMYLNDAFDAEFDKQFRRERPIPTGAISVNAVWRIGLGLLGSGAVCLILLGNVTGILAVLLVLCILAYDAIHKLITVSPVLMAGCRFFLYLVAASTGEKGVTGEAVWWGFALAAYIIGLSFIARKETARGALGYWPCCFLAAPFLMALMMDGPGYLKPALLVSAVLGFWIARCLRYTFGGSERNVGLTVSGLLAGIVWVDLLAVANCSQTLAAVFIALFLSALLFQRYIPAT
ncbi:MAG: UbiA prenyltransferase [Pedosphaera sp.]|nr:UbiA prenyltransferase [Pedosphaera sp.]